MPEVATCNCCTACFRLVIDSVPGCVQGSIIWVSDVKHIGLLQAFGDQGPAGAFEPKYKVRLKRLLSKCFSALSSWSNFRHHSTEKQSSHGGMNVSACRLGVQLLRLLKTVGFCSNAPAGPSSLLDGSIPNILTNSVMLQYDVMVEITDSGCRFTWLKVHGIKRSGYQSQTH